MVFTASEEFISPEGVGERLGVSVYTVRRWIKTGQLRAFKPGKEYRIQQSDLEEFLRAREVRPKAPRHSPYEPSLLNGLEEERRLRFLRGWRAFVWKLERRWEQEPPKTSREIATLFEVMTALMDEGVFEISEATSLAEHTELMLFMEGVKGLNKIADDVQAGEEAEERRAALQVIESQIGA